MKKEVTLESFQFADSVSEHAAGAALVCRGLQGYFIYGEPGSGKTMLAKFLLQRFGVDPVVRAWPQSDREAQRILLEGIEQGYLLLDNVRIKRRGSPASIWLQAFLMCEWWKFRPFRKQHLETIKNDCLVIVTGERGCLDPDLERRLRVIRLEVPAAAVAV